jgi:sigma-E factor negative regulatory protein RseC
MPQGETITHEGKVLRVSGNGTAEVEILVSGACSGCHSKSVCSAGTTESKVIIVKSNPEVRPGDRVTVEMRLSQGFRALVIGYIIPFLVLVTVFGLATAAGTGELVSALLSLLAIGLYYLFIYLFRSIIGKKFEFKIKV